MSTKKSARSDVGASERAKETGQASRQGRASTSHDTTASPQGQGFRVADFLCTGQAHAALLRDLVALTGWSGREVRRQIEWERRNGVPILSDSKSGYWPGEDPDEIAQFVRGMKHRAKQIQMTANAVGEAAGIE